MFPNIENPFPGVLVQRTERTTVTIPEQTANFEMQSQFRTQNFKPRLRGLPELLCSWVDVVLPRATDSRNFFWAPWLEGLLNGIPVRTPTFSLISQSTSPMRSATLRENPHHYSIKYVSNTCPRCNRSYQATCFPPAQMDQYPKTHFRSQPGTPIRHTMQSDAHECN